MTQDEIIEMARQAGLFTHKEVQPEIVAFAKLVAERALAQPEPIQSLQCFHCQDTIETLNNKVMHLLAQRTPPQRSWVGLTPEEFHEACWESYVDPVTGECSTGDREYAVRWTETKLKEKNT
jgi:hypothetical protein